MSNIRICTKVLADDKKIYIVDEKIRDDGTSKTSQENSLSKNTYKMIADENQVINLKSVEIAVKRLVLDSEIWAVKQDGRVQTKDNDLLVKEMDNDFNLNYNKQEFK